MKKILIFVAYLSNYVAHGGINVWTAEEQTIAHSLFAKYCQGPADRGMEGSISWVCKRPQQKPPLVEQYEHVFNWVPPSKERKSVIFVENPPTQYKHQITLKGRILPNQKTHIYVVPGKDIHTIDVKEDVKSGVALEKPSIFYLKGDINEANQESGSENYRKLATTENYEEPLLTENYSASSLSLDGESDMSTSYSEHLPAANFESQRYQRKRVKTIRVVREKRNFARYDPLPITENPERKNEGMTAAESNFEKSVVLHYRRRNLSRFGYISQQAGKEEEDDFVPAASSYYTRHQSQAPQVRPVYIRRPKLTVNPS